MRHPTGGFCLLLFLLGLLALVDHSHDRISTHYWQSAHLQTELQHTLRQAQQSLRVAANKLARDKSFIKNVVWKLTHSAQQSIATATVDEQHWQVTVFDKQCAVLYGSATAATRTLCQHTTRNRIKEQLFQNSSPPQLGYLRTLAVAEGAVLISLPLQEKWLAQQKTLVAHRTALPPTMLVVDSTAVRFVYAQEHYNHLFRHASRYQAALRWLEILLYILIAFLCILLYLLLRRRSHALQRDLQYLSAWSEQPTAGALLQIKLEHTLVQRVLNNFGKTMQAQMHHLSSVKKQISVKNTLLARMSEENRSARDRIAQHAVQATAIDQAAHLNAHFVDNSLAIRDNAQDLRATLFAIHRQQLKPLLQLSNRWQQEFRQRHIADFLGAYYNAEQENFLLHLENDIRQLAKLAKETYTTLTGTLHCARQLGNRTRNLLTPLQFWGQVLTNHTPPLDINLIPTLCRAQELTTKINAPRPVKFSNHFDADYRLLASPAMLIAAFYHLYQCFLAANAQLEITSHVMLQNKQLFVTITASGKDKNIHSSIKKFHLDQAKMILQKYNIEVLLSWLSNTLIVSTVKTKTAKQANSTHVKPSASVKPRGDDALSIS